MPLPKTNRLKIERAVRMILEAVGEDPDAGHFKDTPKRVARMYDKILDGNFARLDRLTSFPEQNYNGIIMVHHVPFYSFCAHHMMPFFGHFAMGYIPGKEKILGLSKLVRVFRLNCKRFTTQEEITAKAVALMEERVKPRGAICYVCAEHTCMSCRGVQAHGALTTTVDDSGVFSHSVELRRLFLDEARSRPGHR